jgi:uridine phosphorylase
VPIHLRPTAGLAPRVILPGDPGRALALAQALLDEPRMFNHHRGLWGYTGTAADGEPMTIQASGMGGPSAAIVVSELADLGARTIVRAGTCCGLDPALGLGDLVVVTEAVAADGASRALGAGERVAADGDVVAALRAAAPGAVAGPVISVDLFYGDEAPRPPGTLAVEMEAAAVLALASRRGLAAGCVLAVSDRLAGDERERIDDDALVAAGEAAGRAAAEALLSLRSSAR